MEADTCPRMGVIDFLYHLPQCLKQANPLGVCFSIGGEE